MKTQQFTATIDKASLAIFMEFAKSRKREEGISVARTAAEVLVAGTDVIKKRKK